MTRHGNTETIYNDCPDFIPDDRLVMGGLYQREDPRQVCRISCVHETAVRIEQIGGEGQSWMCRKDVFFKHWRLLGYERNG